jgi:integrase
VKRHYYEGRFRVYDDQYPKGHQQARNLGYKGEITKRQADRRLQEILAEVQLEEVHAPGPVVTLKEYAEGFFLKKFLPYKKPSTRRGYEQIIRCYLLPYFGKMELNRIRRRDVQDCMNRLVARKLGRRTLNNIRTCLRSIFREAIRDEYLDKNPASDVDLPEYVPRRPEEVPSRETIRQVLNALDDPYQTLAWFVCTTGCRIGEALGLKWGAISFENRYVWFLSAVYMGEEHKTKGHRSDSPVYLAEEAIERLKRFKARVPDVTDDDWVFPDPKHPGRPMTEQHALRGGLKKAEKRLGLDLTWHGLRHWAGTMLHQEGVDIKTIQSRLGHADFRTTANWYIHFSNEAALEAAQPASKLVDGRDSNSAVSPEIVRVTVRVNGGQAGETMVSS